MLVTPETAFGGIEVDKLNNFLGTPLEELGNQLADPAQMESTSNIVQAVFQKYINTNAEALDELAAPFLQRACMLYFAMEGMQETQAKKIFKQAKKTIKLANKNIKNTTKIAKAFKDVVHSHQKNQWWAAAGRSITIMAAFLAISLISDIVYARYHRPS